MCSLCPGCYSDLHSATHTSTRLYTVSSSTNSNPVPHLRPNLPQISNPVRVRVRPGAACVRDPFWFVLCEKRKGVSMSGPSVVSAKECVRGEYGEESREADREDEQAKRREGNEAKREGEERERLRVAIEEKEGAWERVGIGVGMGEGIGMGRRDAVKRTRGSVEARNGKEGLSGGREGSRVGDAKREGEQREGGSGEQCRGRRRRRGNVEEGQRGDKREDERTGGMERMGSGGRRHNKKMGEGGTQNANAPRVDIHRKASERGSRWKGGEEGAEVEAVVQYRKRGRGKNSVVDGGVRWRDGREGKWQDDRRGPQRVASHRSIELELELELDAHENSPEEWDKLEKWKGKQRMKGTHLKQSQPPNLILRVEGEAVLRGWELRRMDVKWLDGISFRRRYLFNLDFKKAERAGATRMSTWGYNHGNQVNARREDEQVAHCDRDADTRVRASTHGGLRGSDTRAWYTLELRVATGSRASAKRRVSAIATRLGKRLATLPSLRHVPFGTRTDLAQECDIEGRGRLEPGWGSARGSGMQLSRKGTTRRKGRAGVIEDFSSP
ncbi:hypothetical protein C8R45DRAFT_941200 [Mycena sanguinolenta]|nr:hypothetical protein C8R45DRAFT_941200 [Mycena sanguinolenta]